MLNSTDRMANEKTERDASARAARRAEEASIVAGLRAALQADEQLLGFARARIAGGIKGRLNIGPEAFFAPFVNIGLTERRFVIQHLHGETGRPSEILPHFFALADIQTIHFADIETYGGDAASRLVLHLANGQSFRLRLTGESNFASAKALADVFRSLTSVRKSASGPTQRVCISCKHIMDRPSKFCPYCGVSQMETEPTATNESVNQEVVSEATAPDIEKVTVVVTEPHGDLLDDALAFLRNDPPAAPVTEPTTEPSTEPSNESTTETASEPAASVDSTPIVTPDESSADQIVANDSNTETETPPTFGSSETVVSTVEEAPVSESVSHEAEIQSVSATFNDFSVPRTWQDSETPVSVDSDVEPVAAAEPTTEPTAVESAPADTSAPITEESPSVYGDGPQATAHWTPEPSVETAPFQYTAPAAAPTPFAQAPAPGFTPSPFTYSEAASTETRSVEEKPPMDRTGTANKGLRVHFHIQHPAVKFDEVITGKDADDIVTQLKDRIVAELKFPVKLYAMRLTPLEFAQEIVSKYNQEERQTLPRPSSCREFLHLVQAIGYATVEDI